MVEESGRSLRAAGAGTPVLYGFLGYVEGCVSGYVDEGVSWFVGNGYYRYGHRRRDHLRRRVYAISRGEAIGEGPRREDGIPCQ